MPTIGASSLMAFPLALGGNTFGWTSDRATSFRVLDAFVAGGGNLIDTADAYSAWAPGNHGGESETIIGAWLAERMNRARVIIATKVSQHPQFRGLGAANIAAAADASLVRLCTDTIDLYYAHFDDAATPLEETVLAFAALVRVGKVRHVGISNYSAARIREWIAIATRHGLDLPIALQPHYNLVFRQPYERDLAPLAAAHGFGVFPYFALASGFLTGKYRTQGDLAGAARERQAGRYFSPAGLAVVDAVGKVAAARGVSHATVALAWLLAKPGITAPLASARTPEQLVELFAATRLELGAAEVAALDAVSGLIPEAAKQGA